CSFGLVGAHFSWQQSRCFVIALLRQNGTHLTDSDIVQKQAHIVAQHPRSRPLEVEIIFLSPSGKSVPKSLLVAGDQVIANDQIEIVCILARVLVMAILPAHTSLSSARAASEIRCV